MYSDRFHFEDGVTVVTWCAGCNAEQAIDQVEVFLNQEWVSIDVGKYCLTRLAAEGKIEK